MTIREMADLVAKEVSGGKVSVIVDKPSDISKRGYAPDVTMKLSADKIGQLGWKPKYGLAEMYKRMIADWQEVLGVQAIG
jgi:nucleoside-diphosphate-sugar epimerase